MKTCAPLLIAFGAACGVAADPQDLPADGVWARASEALTGAGGGGGSGGSGGSTDAGTGGGGGSSAPGCPTGMTDCASEATRCGLRFTGPLCCGKTTNLRFGAETHWGNEPPLVVLAGAVKGTSMVCALLQHELAHVRQNTRLMRACRGQASSCLADSIKGCSNVVEAEAYDSSCRSTSSTSFQCTQRDAFCKSVRSGRSGQGTPPVACPDFTTNPCSNVTTASCTEPVNTDSLVSGTPAAGEGCGPSCGCSEL